MHQLHQDGQSGQGLGTGSLVLASRYRQPERDESPTALAAGAFRVCRTPDMTGLYFFSKAREALLMQ